MSVAIMQDELSSPLLTHYRPSERRAILDHKYYLGIEWGFDPGLERALESWEGGVAELWRHQQQLADCRAQMEEIERHRHNLAQQAGQEIGWEQAAHEWIAHHAAEWRRWRESQLCQPQLSCNAPQPLSH